MKCPTCNGPMLTGELDGERGEFCPFCPPPPKPKTLQRLDLKLPGLDRGPQHNKVIIREDPFQSALVEALERDGYVVQVTSRRVKKAFCDPKAGGCGRWFWPRSNFGDGASKGLADLLVSRYDWPAYTWVAIECKGSDTPLSQEQTALAADQRILVARAEGSIDQSVRKVLEILRQIKRHVVEEEERSKE